MGNCHITLRAQNGILWQPRGVRWSGRWGAVQVGGAMCILWLIHVVYGRRQQNTVKQLSSD